jgi:microcystin-dependent protein
MGNCVDCLKNCGSSLTSDKCVTYTGVDVPILGICNGDSLYEIEAVLIDRLTSVTDGTGITLSDLTYDCILITTLLDGGEPTVYNLVQALITAECQTNTQLVALAAQVNAPFSISGGCLTLPSPTPTRDQVLQAVITQLCSITTTVNTIASDYVKASQLCSLVTACISGTTSQESAKLPKYVAVPYHGPLSVFDANGAGLSSAGYDRVYMCIGQTIGTFTLPDYRGRSPIGANTNVPGGVLDSAVDPALAQNAGYSITPGTKKGEYAHTLSVAENAAHTHSITDPGHTHNYVKDDIASHPSGNSAQNPRTQVSATTTASVTGITVNSSGGSQPHNTTHPSIGTTFIMFVPA